MNVAKKKMAEMPRRKSGTGKKTKKVEVLTQHLTINPWLVSFVYPQFGYITCFASYQTYIGDVMASDIVYSNCVLCTACICLPFLSHSWNSYHTWALYKHPIHQLQCSSFLIKESRYTGGSRGMATPHCRFGRLGRTLWETILHCGFVLRHMPVRWGSPMTNWAIPCWPCWMMHSGRMTCSVWMEKLCGTSNSCRKPCLRDLLQLASRSWGFCSDNDGKRLGRHLTILQMP